MARVTEYDAVVKKIVDGDTIHVDMTVVLFGRHHIYEEVVIRFKDVDTPERGKPGYADAKDHTKKRLMGKRVVIKADHDDMNGERLIGIPYIDGIDFCQELIEKELARKWYLGIEPNEGWPNKWTK